MTDLPNGLLPEVGALKPRVRAILEVGAAITMNDLCERLEDEYKINMKSHVGALKLIVYDVMKEPAIRIALVKVAKVKRNKARRGTGKRENAQKAKKKNAPKRALSAYDIFASERRDAVVEAIRVDGDMVTAAEIDDRTCSLWNAETDKERYTARAQKDRERYADEKATFDKEGDARRDAQWRGSGYKEKNCTA
jgi:hypothetical protein